MARDFDRGRLLVPDPITVTLTRPASYSGGPEVSVSVRHVQGQPADESAVEHPMGAGALEGTRGVFRVWLVETGTLGAPHRGYLVREQDGSVWHVDRVDLLSHGRQFRLHCTKRPS